MPRLDNSSQDVIMHFSLDYNFDDPGDNQPLDFCLACWEKEVKVNDLDFLATDHPPYESGKYSCNTCKRTLQALDNEDFLCASTSARLPRLVGRRINDGYQQVRTDHL